MRETAGRPPAEAVIGLLFELRDNPMPGGAEVVWTGEGEWKITLDVFRDLGSPSAARCCSIYILLVYQTGSYLIPLVQMISIPLTIIGIMPGFWLLNLATGTTVGGLCQPGLLHRHRDDRHDRPGRHRRPKRDPADRLHPHVRDRGASLKEALIESGAVRFRPIFLTAGAAMLGAWPITLDPVFSGLAWALIFGLVVSTAFTLLLVPVVYWMLYRESEGRE